MIERFRFLRSPDIHFGIGAFKEMEGIISGFGDRILLVTGARSFQASGNFNLLTGKLKRRGIDYFNISVPGEPSPDLVDEAASRYRDADIDMVVAIGGGSVIDAGKAISAMLLVGGSVIDYLEGVGAGMNHSGLKVPFMAVPTTAGTGSEASTNAVLSRVGDEGFKKSFRHPNFIPDVAVVDPELMLTCPEAVTAASGMDALTQLLESYLSTRANPITDAIALSGMGFLKDSLLPACANGANDVGARAGMAYASLVSGITLANVGLGVVHGFASSIGGLFDIPHGVICGTLVGSATETNIGAMEDESGFQNNYLVKYANVGALLAGADADEVEKCCRLLVEKINEWVTKLNIPRLSECGVKASDIERIVNVTGIRNNPVELERDKLREILSRRVVA